MKAKQDYNNLTWKVCEFYKEFDLKLDNAKDRKEINQVLSEYGPKRKELERLKDIAEDNLDSLVLHLMK